MASGEKIAAIFFGCLVYLLGAMSRVAVPGMVFEEICREYALTHAQVAMLPSIGVLGCMAFIGIGGIAVDRYGWRLMLLLGSLLQAFGYVSVHECRDLYLMLVGEFLNGGGRTIVYLSILKLFDVSFDRKYFAALIGIFYIFSYGGTLSASSIYPTLIEWCGSWQLAARAINYGTLICAAFIALTFIARSKDSCLVSERKSVFSYKAIMKSIADGKARLAISISAINIAVYWSFLCVSAKSIASASIISKMNLIVMFGMVFSGSISLIFGNKRKPFFLWSASALTLGFALLLIGSVVGTNACLQFAFILIGAGYGVTAVLLAGTKECVPYAFMASAIGFTNFFANIIQIVGNQMSGYCLGMGQSGYPYIFSFFLVLSALSLVLAIRYVQT